MRGVLLVLSLVVTACAGSPPYRPFLPPQQAPQQRVAQFNELRATHHTVTYVRRCHKRGCDYIPEDSLNLANGRSIDDPDDLTPLVMPNSTTARNIRRAARAKGWEVGLGLVALGMAVTGLAVGIDGFDDSFGVTRQTKIGFGVLLGAFVPGFGAGAAHYYRTKATVDAFESYTPDLALRLNVCTRGYVVVACEDMGGPPGATNE